MRTKNVWHCLLVRVRNSDKTVMGGWRNGKFCYTVMNHMVKLLHMIFWKAENELNEFVVLGKEVSWLNVDSISWLL